MLLVAFLLLVARSKLLFRAGQSKKKPYVDVTREIVFEHERQCTVNGDFDTIKGSLDSWCSAMFANQPTSDGLQANSDGLQPNSKRNLLLRWIGESFFSQLHDGKDTWMQLMKGFECLTSEQIETWP